MGGRVPSAVKKRRAGGGGHPLPPKSAKTNRLFQGRNLYFVWNYDGKTNPAGSSFLEARGQPGPERGGG